MPLTDSRYSNQFTKCIPSPDSTYVWRGDDWSVEMLVGSPSTCCPGTCLHLPVVGALWAPLVWRRASFTCQAPFQRRPFFPPWKETLLPTMLSWSSRGITRSQEEKQQQLGCASHRMKSLLRSSERQHLGTRNEMRCGYWEAERGAGDEEAGTKWTEVWRMNPPVLLILCFPSVQSEAENNPEKCEVGAFSLHPWSARGQKAPTS